MFSIEKIIEGDWVTPVYDHVHHGRCFYLFEESRVALLDHIGCPYDKLLAQGQAIVIARVEADYKREVKAGKVTVTCEEPAIEGRNLILKQKILNERGKVAVEARIEMVFMDLQARRGMYPPDAFKEAFLAWSKC